ncbi:MAG: diguanylate cyclase [Sulfuricella sp.]|nr:diguanylate cyclase [Sulfuricella sp.]
MSERPLSVRSKIALLRAKFIEQLPRRVEEALRLFAALRANPHDKDAAANLHRFLHSIKGTGNSFGFSDLGTIAGRGESLAGRLLENPAGASPAFWDELGEVLANINLGAEVIAEVGGYLAQEKEVPHFELPKIGDDKDPGGRLIYLCDDEALQVEQLATQLRCFGYVTITFNSPAELAAAVKVKRPSAIVMDINFPGGVSGTEALHALNQEIDEPLPAIFLSGRDDFEARLSAVQAGGSAYFLKPTHPLELVATLDELTVQKKPEPYRVLVVDDEPEIAAYHCLILQEARMITYQVHKPERVLEVLQEFRPDMVLMDMYMPGCTGRDLAQLIRQVPDYVGLPIVYLSSETDRKKQFSAMRVGAEGFLTKPIQPEDLVTAVAIRAERMRILRTLMARDSLTGLYNHTTTTQLLDSALSNAARHQLPLCFVMIDVDNFKSVNDTYGHPVGDQVLLALARVLQQRLRNSDIVGRYGGEEFAAILHEIELVHAAQIIDQLREDFSKVRFHAGDAEFSCTFSAGIAAFPQFKRLEILREAADRALYDAKKQGRNRVMTNR